MGEGVPEINSCQIKRKMINSLGNILIYFKKEKVSEIRWLEVITQKQIEMWKLIYVLIS